MPTIQAIFGHSEVGPHLRRLLPPSRLAFINESAAACEVLDERRATLKLSGLSEG